MNLLKTPDTLPICANCGVYFIYLDILEKITVIRSFDDCIYIYIYELHSHRNIYHNSPTPVSCSKVLAIYSHTKHWHDIIDYVCLIVYPLSKDWRTQPDETPTWYQWLSAKQQYLQHISTILHSAFKNIWIFMKYALIKICNKNCWNYRIENIIQINIFYPKYSQTVVFDEGVSIVLLGFIFFIELQRWYSDSMPTKCTYTGP